MITKGLGATTLITKGLGFAFRLLMAKGEILIEAKMPVEIEFEDLPMPVDFIDKEVNE